MNPYGHRSFHDNGYPPGMIHHPHQHHPHHDGFIPPPQHHPHHDGFIPPPFGFIPPPGIPPPFGFIPPPHGFPPPPNPHFNGGMPPGFPPMGRGRGMPINGMNDHQQPQFQQQQHNSIMPPGIPFNNQQQHNGFNGHHPQQHIHNNNSNHHIHNNNNHHNDNVINQNQNNNNNNSNNTTPNKITPSTTTSTTTTTTTTTPTSTSTTAYIGKIPQFVDDSFIKSLLEKCGKIIKWARASETNGKLKAFGFCEYEHAEGAITALRVLNELEVDREGGKIIVKVDNGQKFYRDYLDKKGGLTDQTSDSPQDITLRDSIKTMVEKNFINIYEKKKIESIEINDFYNKDRRDLTKDEKIKIIEKEKEKEKQRFKDRELKNKERDLKDFKEREKNWERRERTKEIDREKEKDKEREKELKEIKARQLEMEEYSDSDEKMRKRIRSRDAVKYRQKEKEEDDKDRAREQMELQELEAKRQKEEELNRIQLTVGSINSSGLGGTKKLKLIGKTSFSVDNDDDNKDENGGGDDNDNGEMKINGGDGIERSTSNLSSSSSLSTSNSSMIINNKKQTFIPLDYNEIDKVLNPVQYQAQQQAQIAALNIDEFENQMVSSTVSPADKDQIFKTNIDWSIIDQHSIIDEKIKPWTTKKVIEFFGSKEDEFIDFILNLLKSHLSPNEIITKLRDVFENNADDFVLKLWRILLFLINSIKLLQ